MTTIIVALIGVLGTVGAALGSQFLTNQREMRRLNQEKELKRLELEEKRREQLRSERLNAYMELAASTSLIDPHIDEWEGLAAPFSKIQLMTESQELVSAAEALKDAAFLARQTAKDLFKQGKESGKQSVKTDEIFVQQFLDLQQLRDEFVTLARANLTQKVPESGGLEVVPINFCRLARR